MCKLLDSPVMQLELFRELYTPDNLYPYSQIPDDEPIHNAIYWYRQGNSLSYSYPTFQMAMEALKEISLICYDNDIHLSQTLKSGILNHIITLKIRR